jgi:hypothetical protein
VEKLLKKAVKLHGVNDVRQIEMHIAETKL